MSNTIIGDSFSNPINSIRLQNMQHQTKRTEFPSPTLLGAPKKVNPSNTMHPDSTILKRSTIPTLPMGERQSVQRIKSKSINEMVLEAITEAIQINHVGISSPKKILQKTQKIKNNLLNSIRLKEYMFAKNKTDLGSSPKWSTKKLG